MNYNPKNIIKRITAVVVAAMLLLFLSCCGATQDEEPTETTETVMQTEPATEPATEPTTEPTEPAPTEPVWEPGILKAGYAEGLYEILPAGTEVEVVGQFKDYYVVKGEAHDTLVEKRFIRLNSEEPFEGRTMYARANAEVYASVYMRGEPVAVLSTNTVLTVLEGKGDWLLVEWDGGKGYLLEASASNTYITYANPGQGSGAPADGTDVDVGSLSYGQTTGGIVLLGAYHGPEQEAGFEAGRGIVIADDVESYLVLGMRDDEVKVTAQDEEYCTVWLEDELYVKLPRWLVRLEGDEAYEPWDGYSKWNAAAYAEYQLRNEVMQLQTNTEVTVLDEIPEKLYSNPYPGCYVVMIEGELYYMTLDSVSETRIQGGTGNGGNGNGGGGDIWTPPAL